MHIFMHLSADRSDDDNNPIYSDDIYNYNSSLHGAIDSMLHNTQKEDAFFHQGWSAQ